MTQNTPKYVQCAAARTPQPSHHQTVVEDVTEVLGTAWNDETVLQNCRMRFLSRKPYTAAGSVMLAVNPYKSFSELYERDIQVKRTRR